MYDEPARPSPTPAPIAPPARAMPPPMNAPAVVTAESLTAMSVFSLVGRQFPDALVTSGAAGPAGSARWFWFGGCVGLCRFCLVVVLVVRAVVLVVVVVVVAGAGHPEVEDG